MWNPESTDVESGIHRRGIHGIHSVESGYDPRPSWITSHGVNFSILFPVFFPYFQVKIRGKTAIILYMRDTLDEEDVWKIYVEYKTYICKSRSHEDDFSSKFRCRRAADNDFPACVTSHGKLRMGIMTRQTNSNYLVSPIANEPLLPANSDC